MEFFHQFLYLLCVVFKILFVTSQQKKPFISDEPRGEMGVFQKFLYLVCFVSKQDLENDERHRTNAKAQKEHDIQEATKFFRESKFWKRLFLASYLT
jgi:hypothetical protein